ncbi:MAG: hypothetical protein AAGI11_05060 [Pseudomonadota bacterium]
MSVFRAVLVLPLFWLAAAAAAQSTNAELLKLLPTLVDVFDAYLERSESIWERDFEGRLKGQEVMRPLEQANRKLAAIRASLNDAPGAGQLVTPEQEEIAMEVIELHWELELDTARRYLALLRDEVPGAPGYRDIASKLIQQREELAAHAFTFLDVAKQEEREFAWEAWAELADGVLDVKDGPGSPSQLDDFLKSAKILEIDPVSGEQARLDMTPWFEPLAIEWPDSEPVITVYPDVEGRRTSRIISVLGAVINLPEEVRSNMHRDPRILYVMGEGIAKLTRYPELEFEAGWMDYEILTTFTPANPFKLPQRRGESLSDVYFGKLRSRGVDVETAFDLVNEFDLVQIEASPRKGAMPGVYEFKLAGQVVTWVYGRSPNRPAAYADLRVVRALPDGSFIPLNTIFESDHFAFEVELDHDINQDVLDVSIARWDPVAEQAERLSVEGSSSVNLKRVAGAEGIVFRSEVYRSPAAVIGKMNADTNKTLNLPAGYELFVSLPVSTPIVAPVRAYAVTRAPEDVDHSWWNAFSEAGRMAQIRVDRSTPTTRLVGEIDAGGSWNNSDVMVTLGDYASMLLLRDELMNQLEDQLAGLEAQSRELSDPDAANRWWEETVGPALRFRDAAIFSLPIEIDGVEASTLGAASAEVFVQQSLGGYEQDKSTLAQAAARSLESHVRDALEKLAGTDVEDLRELMEIIGSYVEPLKKPIIPDLVRLETIGNDTWWVPEDLGRNHMNSIEQKLSELQFADDLQDAEKDVVIAVITGLSVVASGPAVAFVIRTTPYAANSGVVGLRAAALIGESMALSDSVYRKWGQYIAQRDEVRFARGTLGVLSHERFDDAVAKQKPGWMLVAEISAGVIGFSAEAIAFGQAFRLSAKNLTYFSSPIKDMFPAVSDGAAPIIPVPPQALVTPAQIQSIDDARVLNQLLDTVEAGGLDAFRLLTREEHDRLIAVMSIFDEADQAAFNRFLPEGLLTRAQRVGQALQDEIQLRNLDSARWWDEEVSRFKEMGTVLDDERVITTERPLWFPGESGDGLQLDARNAAGGQQESLALGARLGEGSAAVVHEIQGRRDVIAKLYKARKGPDQAIEDVEQTIETSQKLAAADIPHLAVMGKGRQTLRKFGSTKGNELVFALQERLPDGARTIKYRRVRSETSASGYVMRGFQIAGLDPQMKRLPRAYQHAMLRLFKKLAEANLIWEDVHLGNVYFFRRGLYWEAGLLDLDRIHDFGSPTEDLLGLGRIIDQMSTGNHGVNSLRRESLLIDPDRWGRWLDADFFMQKMLEHKNYVYYDANTKTWLSNYMDLELVERYFPNFRNQLLSRN